MGACGAFFSLCVHVQSVCVRVGDDVFLVATWNLFVIFTRCRKPLLGASCRPSVFPEPSTTRSMPLLILWLSPTEYCCRERQNSSFVLEYTSSRVLFLYAQQVGWFTTYYSCVYFVKNGKCQLWLRLTEWLKPNFASCMVHQTHLLGVLILYFIYTSKYWFLWTKPTIWLFILSFIFVFFMRLLPQVFFTRTRMIRAHSPYEAKQGCGVVSCTTFSYWGAFWSKVIVLIWYRMCVREDCYFWFFMEKRISLFLVGTWYVVGSRYDFFSASLTCGATHAGRILFDIKRKRKDSCVWCFEVRVTLLLDRSRSWMILTGAQLWNACGHTTVVYHT